MLKLKGQTGSGKWVEFQVDDIIDTFDGEVKISLDRNVWVISDTIQPAEPCQHLISLMAGLEIPGPEFWYNRHPHDLELVGAEIANQAKSVIQPADDQRKAMLNEIRKKVAAIKAYRDPASDFKFDVFDILDEMEANL